MRELELIERIRRTGRAGNTGVRVGIGDDCAVLRVPEEEEMLVTTDFSLEGRHFRRDWHTAESAGWRCLARGLSDVAAMGGRPVAAFLSLALPRGFEPAWVDGFMAGFHALAERFAVELAGGDTAQAPGDGVLADVVVVGAAAQGRALLRSGARAGEGVYVTGRLGASALELAELAAGTVVCGREGGGRQTFPLPRIEVGRALVGLASACMDLSDGLSTDLAHLCRASGVGAALESARLPLAPGATLEQALHGGEDYELLFTSPGTVPAQLAGIEVHRIGVVEGSGVRLDGRPLAPAGWEHFGTGGMA